MILVVKTVFNIDITLNSFTCLPIGFDIWSLNATDF